MAVTSGFSNYTARHLSVPLSRVHARLHRTRFLPLCDFTAPPCTLSRLISLKSLVPRRSVAGGTNIVACAVAVKVNGTAEESTVQEPAIGSKIRVNKPLTVYHVPKIPEFDLSGHEGHIKDIIKTWKGKTVSANLPYKVQFQLEIDGRSVKFIAHLKEGEFEVVH